MSKKEKPTMIRRDILDKLCKVDTFPLAVSLLELTKKEKRGAREWIESIPPELIERYGEGVDEEDEDGTADIFFTGLIWAFEDLGDYSARIEEKHAWFMKCAVEVLLSSLFLCVKMQNVTGPKRLGTLLEVTTLNSTTWDVGDIYLDSYCKPIKGETKKEDGKTITSGKFTVSHEIVRRQTIIDLIRNLESKDEEEEKKANGKE